MLFLRREYSYYLLQLYVPSVMLVVTSWVSFWLDKDAVPARVSLGITTLLTMTTQASGVNSKLPPVSYTKAIDVWIGTCLAFLFMALLQFALVNYAARMAFLDRTKRSRLVSLIPPPPPPVQPGLMTDSRRGGIIDMPTESDSPRPSTFQSKLPRRHFRYIRQWFKRYHKNRAKMIDVIARIAFPIVFSVFNIAYWTMYLV